MSLSPRETEIVTLIADGFSDKEVARALNTSIRTIGTHKARIFAKLGARHSAHMVGLAYRRGILGDKNGEGLDMDSVATSQAVGEMGRSSPDERRNGRRVRESGSTRVDST